MVSIFAAVTFFFFSQLAGAAPLHIMIDPGHGGVDTGATRGNLKESEIALKVSSYLADLLRQDPRFQVSMTRTTDTKISLDHRTEAAEAAKADLFLSIHLNSSRDPRARGQEFYFQNQIPVDEESMFLASRENEEVKSETDADGADAKAEPLSSKSDLKRIIEDLHRNHRVIESSEIAKILLETWLSNSTTSTVGSRAIRQAPFRVVSNIKIPSVLVEIGFISHATEGLKLAQVDHQKDMAQRLYKGLIKFKETIDKDHAENLKSVHEI
jgi:N-acetylmuramoyl-L-alanine amidase